MDVVCIHNKNKNPHKDTYIHTHTLNHIHTHIYICKQKEESTTHIYICIHIHVCKQNGESATHDLVLLDALLLAAQVLEAEHVVEVVGDALPALLRARGEADHRLGQQPCIHRGFVW